MGNTERDKYSYVNAGKNVAFIHKDGASYRPVQRRGKWFWWLFNPCQHVGHVAIVIGGANIILRKRILIFNDAGHYWWKKVDHNLLNPQLIEFLLGIFIIQKLLNLILGKNPFIFEMYGLGWKLMGLEKMV